MGGQGSGASLGKLRACVGTDCSACGIDTALRAGVVRCPAAWYHQSWAGPRWTVEEAWTLLPRCRGRMGAEGVVRGDSHVTVVEVAMGSGREGEGEGEGEGRGSIAGGAAATVGRLLP